MSIQRLTFQNSSGQKLSARLSLPINQAPKAYTLFAHCFTCNKHLTAIHTISKALNRNGFGVLRFDFTGLGESEGDFADTNFSSNVQDLIAAADYMQNELQAPCLLIGHSLGGAAVIFADKEIASVQAVITIGAPSSPQHVQHLLQGDIDQIEQKGVAKVSIGGRTFTIKKQFLEDLEEKNMQSTIKELKKPLLLLHSPHDKTVGVENAAEIYQAAMHPKSFVSLDGADHLLRNKKDADYVGEIIASWASRYIKIPKKEKLRTHKDVVVQIGKDKYTTEILAGQHAIVADEPESLGGKDYGPSPYDLLMASLGACTAMTLRMYADRKKWDLEEVRVHLSHQKVHTEDCQDCESKNQKIDKIERHLELKGKLDEKQRKRLLQIANKCPVHRTLHNPIEVHTDLIDN